METGYIVQTTDGTKSHYAGGRSTHHGFETQREADGICSAANGRAEALGIKTRYEVAQCEAWDK